MRAESMVAIAHQAYQAAEYDEAIIALEESLALRLFAYTDQKTLDRWQQGLVMPGTQYRHDKKAIADSLVLRSDCLVQLARVSGVGVQQAMGLLCERGYRARSRRHRVLGGCLSAPACQEALWPGWQG